MRTVIVFAKPPRRGTAKKRLARAIGDGPALSFYRTNLLQLLQRLARDPRWRVVVAVTPDKTKLRVPRGVTLIAQGRGDLGARMARALDPRNELGNGPAVIVGSDVPSLDADHVWRAFRALGAHRFTFGPAPDGGYWLVGADRRRAQPHRLFRDVRWSSAHALADSLATLPPGTACVLDDRLDDVDDGDSYARWRAA
jgi:rSAM/selenodomain-associated transferase 1